MARRKFGIAERMLASLCYGGSADRGRWLKLVAVRRALGDADGALQAVSGILAIDPLDFMGLLLKAGLLDQTGHADLAAELYEAALFHAPPTESLPSGIQSELASARLKVTAHQTEVVRQLETLTAAIEREASPIEAARMSRFRTNVGRLTQPFHSQPTHFAYPGLLEREFHDREAFPWLADLERAAPAIQADLERLLRREHLAAPYIQYPSDAPVRQWKALNHSRAWTAVHLIAEGKRVEPNAALCAATMTALKDVAQPIIPGRSPNAMFSILAPGAHIPPHNGVANTRLVCHLALTVPEGCWFRVGAETRRWRAGEAFVFDDTIEHEARNESASPRVVLIIDVWHPELSDLERSAVAAVIAARGKPDAGI